MRYVDQNVKDLVIAYIGGGSRGWAWGFMMDLAMDSQMEGTVRLYDIDEKAAEKNRIIGEKISAHPDARAQWRYEVAPSLAEALRGADIVVISILPGTFAEMRSDVHQPEKYGVWQSVGDTVGPGGMIRALRTIPMFVEIAEAIRDFAPEAWVINYTNPMSVCMATLYEVFPGIRAFGCCHEVFGTQKLLAAMLADMCGIESVVRQDIKVNVLGINHFTWFDSASYQHMDLFPVFETFSRKYDAAGFLIPEDRDPLKKSFVCNHRVKFDLFRRYGLIAAAGDRHLAEFMPPVYYLKDPETVEAWGFALTSVDWREDDLARRLARSDALVSGEEALALTPSGEEGHLLLKALLGLGDLVSNVNMPNRGQIANLPQGAIVETNALFRRGEIRPVSAGGIPDSILPLISRHVDNQRNTLHAALETDYRLVESTFLNDPQLACLSPIDGEQLLREMMRNTARYLPSGYGI
ncbi:alpha-glucosidase/alpha-galactosidase [Eubacteriales bacterium OttesenSCG-928-A19]|nr:alpha-glucosidase/alpha-galactosidase [Eubacteriales bacterium OttesenSCG-928-A19]